MTRGKKPRRDPDQPPGNLPEYVWLVAGVDYNGTRYDEVENTAADAEAAAELLNRKGGRVTVTRCRWNGPAANWLPCPED